jgi:hypothetical protein
MMNSHEFKHAQDLYRQAMFAEGPQGKPKGNIKFQGLIDFYHSISGVYEPNPNVIIHHRRADFGPLCLDCKKPYRSHQSTQCEECGSVKREYSLEPFI